MMPERRYVLGRAALASAGRVVWLICIGVYLTVFVGGVLQGGDELLSMARAVAFTLAAGLLGHTAVGLLGQASLPIEQGPSAAQTGPLGSLADLIDSTNVGQQEHVAEAAEER
jgi:hypothetical protein